LNLRPVFVHENGALRAVWRIALFCAVSIVAYVVIGAILGPALVLLFRVAGAGGVTTEYLVEALGLLAGTAIMIRYVDRRPWADVWMSSASARPAPLITGFALGALAIGLPILLLIALGWLQRQPGPRASWWAAAARVTLLLLPAALLEELLSRGYIFSVLCKAWGWKWTLAVTSIAFGLMHLANNGASARSTLLVILAGVFLGAVLLATQSLYAAWAAHFAWNWTMAVLFHTAVSGFPMEAPQYSYVASGPNWATGGIWGPEGGLPAGLGMVGALIYLIARRRWTSGANREET
jgi:membrane protease YdiL (CAAX protease family)